MCNCNFLAHASLEGKFGQKLNRGLGKGSRAQLLLVSASEDATRPCRLDPFLLHVEVVGAVFDVGSMVRVVVGGPRRTDVLGRNDVMLQ